ncbi:hypothetical protein J31TS6_48020 [Brevibacillus reuszeri]|nr:hypothetical protein J31TS6_48020 [Brevibacillus reuszeri]
MTTAKPSIVAKWKKEAVVSKDVMAMTITTMERRLNQTGFFFIRFTRFLLVNRDTHDQDRSYRKRGE